MSRSFSVVFVTLLATSTWGCEPTPQRIGAGEKIVDTVLGVSLHSAIRSELKTRYAEPFVVDDSGFEPGLNMYQFRAHPKRTPEVVVHGNFDERQAPGSRLRSDNYVNEAYSRAAAEHFKTLVDSRFHRAVGASVYSVHEHAPGQSLLDFDAYLAARPDGSTIRLNRYVFHLPQSAADPVIAELRRNAEALKSRYGNSFSLYVGFWEPEFLAGKDPEKLSFGFEAKKLRDADDLLTEMKHMKQVLFVKWTSGKAEPLSDQALFEMIRPVAPGPTEMLEL